MKNPSKAIVILLMVALMASGAMSVVSALPDDGPTPMGESRGTFQEVGDETRSLVNSKELNSGDTYYGHVDRVDDRADYFKIDAVQQEVLNVHMYIMGHDGVNQWVPPDDAPPTPGRPTGIFGVYLYTGLSMPERQQPIDGAFNFFYTRHYVLNICCPVPSTNTYYINVSIDWFMTPNNFTWDYMLEVDISNPQVITSGNPVTNTIDLETRDTDWYKVKANFEEEINGSFEILNFNSGDPTERDLNIWIFPEDVGGYPFSYPWDWSAAPNEPLEPISILATYEEPSWYFIKLRGMNHTNSLPVSYRLVVHTKAIPTWPITGVQDKYFDRFTEDTDWYKFTMKANQPHPTKPGLWNEVVYFNMTERADAEDLPDFDLYLFGRVPGSRWLDLLDSSFRNDHPDFFDPNRDPNKNTEHVRAAAFYNGTYYIEVNAWNNTGYYNCIMRTKDSTPSDIYPTPQMQVSDNDNLPDNAMEARAGVYESTIHQAFDHYDWYKVEARERIRVQFDSFKGQDLFNASLFKYDAIHDEYVLIKGGWNTWFNFTTREDNLGNLIDFNVNLADLGLGAGTYYIGVFAAVAAQMAWDSTTNRAFIYKTDSDAESNYELRLWVDDAPPFTRPPQIIKPIADVTVEEDTNLLDYLNLYDYFKDTDVGDEILRFKASIITGKLSRLILQEDSLGFEAFPDFTGKVKVKVTAIDRKYLQTSLTWNITFTQVNDPPKALYDTAIPFEYTMPEDSVRIFDLKVLVTDVDRDDEVNITFAPSDNLNIVLDPETLMAEITGAQDWFGEEIVTFVARDLSGETTNLPVKFIVNNVEDAPKVLKQIGERIIEEDTYDEIRLSDYFVDPDKEDLMFTLSSNLNVGFEVDYQTTMMTLVPDPDWWGFREIWISATDTTGRTAQMRFSFIVNPVNDPPEINSVSPALTEVTLREQASQSFVVLNVTDPEFSILIYNWYLDGKMVGPSNFYNYKPSNDEQGTHELKVVVTDEGGLPAEHVWTVIVQDVPRPPEGGVASPVNNGKFLTTEKIPFVALYYDLDGDIITYQWFIDDKPVSTEPDFTRRLSEGKHRIRIEVSSGDITVKSYLNVTAEPPDTPGFEAPLVFAGMAVTFVAAAAWRRLRMR